MLLKKGQYGEAIAEYQSAVTLDPKFVRAYIYLGVILTGTGHPEKGAVNLLKGVGLSPTIKEAHFNLGFALVLMGRHEEAINEFQEAIALDPKNPELHAMVGRALEGNGRIDEAITEYKKALALNPKFRGAQEGLAAAQRKKTERPVPASPPTL